MKKIYDVIVVGGGPIGSYVSTLLAKKDICVALIEQRKIIGEPVRCAGLVSPTVFSQFHIPKKDIVQQEITSACIHAPDGKLLRIGNEKIQAYSIDRTRFDQYLFRNAQNNGVITMQPEKVIQVKKNNQKITLKTNRHREYTGSLVIGADGPHSIIRNQFHFTNNQELLKGIGAEIEHIAMDSSLVEIFVGTTIAPGFFAWVIPTNEDGTNARIGLCVPHTFTPKKLFHSFFSTLQKHPQFSTAKITKFLGGNIPLGIMKKTIKDHVMIVGDAAAQIKPTSGGGIYPGLSCASICAKIAEKAIQQKKYSANFLKQYDKQWKKEIGKELIRGMHIRRIFTRLSDEDFNRYIEYLDQPSIINIINTYGDIDHPSRLIKPLFKQTPALLKVLPHYLSQKSY